MESLAESDKRGVLYSYNSSCDTLHSSPTVLLESRSHLSSISSLERAELSVRTKGGLKGGRVGIIVPGTVGAWTVDMGIVVKESNGGDSEDGHSWAGDWKDGDGDGKVTEATGELVATAVVMADVETFLSDDIAVVIVEIYTNAPSPVKILSMLLKPSV